MIIFRPIRFYQETFDAEGNHTKRRTTSGNQTGFSTGRTSRCPFFTPRVFRRTPYWIAAAKAISENWLLAFRCGLRTPFISLPQKCLRYVGTAKRDRSQTAKRSNERSIFKSRLVEKFCHSGSAIVANDTDIVLDAERKPVKRFFLVSHCSVGIQLLGPFLTRE